MLLLTSSLLFYLLLLSYLILSAPSIRQTFKDMNTNEDKVVDRREFEAWFNYQDIEQLKRNARDHFEMFDKNGDRKVNWDEYASMSFGLTRQEICNDIFQGKRPLEFSKLDEQIQLLILAAVRRWKAAIATLDGLSMSPEEFSAFTYPELYEHMRHTLVMEAVDKYDKNKDRKVTVYEVLNKKTNSRYTREQAKEFSQGTLPNIEQHLLGLRDNDQDGVVDEVELGDWVMENRKLIRGREAGELFGEIDEDGDGAMTYSEFESEIDVVRGSSVGIGREEL